jgi:succinate-acetate transporter protein
MASSAHEGRLVRDVAGSAADDESREAWVERTRVVLTPIAAPSILGLFGFASATFMVAAHEAWGYGGKDAGLFLAPFAATFGGLAQFAAGIMAYRARDGVATAMHGMWGAFWLAYGLLNILFATGALTEPTGQFPEFGYWFVTLSAITFAGAFAAWFENLAVFSVLITLAVGAGLLAVGDLTATGGDNWADAGGWVLIASALLAFYTAAALMVHGAAGRVILPMFERGNLGSSAKPGKQISEPIEYADGMPGAKQGQ